MFKGQPIPERLVGVAGTFCSGKDKAARYLTDTYGFVSVTSSDILRQEASARGLPDDRQTLIGIGVELDEQDPGLGFFLGGGLRRYAAVAESGRRPGGLALCGLRIVGVARRIQQAGGAVLFIDAPPELRYRRMQNRQRDNEAATVTMEEFMAQGASEMAGNGNEHAPNIGAVKSLADTIIQNDGKLDALHLAIDRSLGLA